MKDEMIKSGDTERVPEAAGDGRAEGMAENSAAEGLLPPRRQLRRAPVLTAIQKMPFLQQ